MQVNIPWKERDINNEKYGNGDVIAKEDINKLNKEVKLYSSG